MREFTQTLRSANIISHTCACRGRRGPLAEGSAGPHVSRSLSQLCLRSGREEEREMKKRKGEREKSSSPPEEEERGDEGWGPLTMTPALQVQSCGHRAGSVSHSSPLLM